MAVLVFGAMVPAPKAFFLARATLFAYAVELSVVVILTEHSRSSAVNLLLLWLSTAFVIEFMTVSTTLA